MFFKSSTCAVVVFSALALLSHIQTSVEAHSWAACIDWRRKNPSNTKSMWGDDDGECLGYARRYPYKEKFASLDDFNPSRHYQQKGGGKDLDEADPCSTGENGKEHASDETRADPPEEAYDEDEEYGRMTTTRVGDTLCIRWPAKNHAGDNERDNMEVLIALAKNQGADPDQKTLNKNIVAKLRYKDCDGNGHGGNQDTRPCGGCFKVPLRASGTYLLQWRWMLNKGEWYTSCADVKIGA